MTYVLVVAFFAATVQPNAVPPLTVLAVATEVECSAAARTARALSQTRWAQCVRLVA